MSDATMPVPDGAPDEQSPDATAYGASVARSPGREVSLILALGVATTAVAWMLNRSREQPLEQRTRDRLRPRGDSSDTTATPGV